MRSRESLRLATRIAGSDRFRAGKDVGRGHVHSIDIEGESLPRRAAKNTDVLIIERARYLQGFTKMAQTIQYYTDVLVIERARYLQGFTKMARTIQYYTDVLIIERARYLQGFTKMAQTIQYYTDVLVIERARYLQGLTKMTQTIQYVEQCQKSMKEHTLSSIHGSRLYSCDSHGHLNKWKDIR